MQGIFIPKYIRAFHFLDIKIGKRPIIPINLIIYIYKDMIKLKNICVKGDI
jgi:hypothetical protein